MTAYTVKCSLSGAETVEAVKAHLNETQKDFDKRYVDWKLKNKTEIGSPQRINMAQKILQLPISEVYNVAQDLNVQVRKLIDGPIGQSGRHIVAKKREKKDQIKRTKHDAQSKVISKVAANKLELHHACSTEVEDPDWHISRRMPLCISDEIAEEEQDSVQNLGMKSFGSEKILNMIMDKDRGAQNQSQTFFQDSKGVSPKFSVRG